MESPERAAASRHLAQEMSTYDAGSLGVELVTQLMGVRER